MVYVFNLRGKNFCDVLVSDILESAKAVSSMPNVRGKSEFAYLIHHYYMDRWNRLRFPTSTYLSSNLQNESKLLPMNISEIELISICNITSFT